MLEAVASGAGLAVAPLSVALGFTGQCFSPYWALPIDYSPRSPGLVSGLLNTSGNIAGIVAPAVTGAIVTATGSWNIALFISARLSMVGVIVLRAFSRRATAPIQVGRRVTRVAVEEGR